MFALFLKILYLGSGRRFGEHVLFALHTKAFAYFIFGVMLLVNVGVIDFVLWCWLLLYLPWAMRHVLALGGADDVLHDLHLRGQRPERRQRHHDPALRRRRFKCGPMLAVWRAAHYTAENTV